ncbi:MAG: hydroxymethylbilane synthase [Omnitrophica bacterium]|nr:hydroxymethylbilane synthase [Candidatus Omnitrophota bacterium]
MQKIYKVGTRTSALALKQVEAILASLNKFYPAWQVEIVGINTYGDKDRNTPISQIEGSSFFTDEIDEALSRGELDFAVHSAKDLADNLREGLTVAAITSSIDPYDVLVAKASLTLDRLPYGAKIGTSSLRRKTQLKKYRPDFQIIDIRGNIEERLNLLDNDKILNLDALVIAAAGLIRLGLEDRITQRIPFEILRPHPLQGSLAVLTKTSNIDLIKLLSKLDCREASWT